MGGGMLKRLQRGDVACAGRCRTLPGYGCESLDRDPAAAAARSRFPLPRRRSRSLRSRSNVGSGSVSDFVVVVVVGGGSGSGCSDDLVHFFAANGINCALQEA